MLSKQEPRTQHDPLPVILVCALLFRIPMPVTEFRRYSRGNVYPVCPRCKSSLDREYMVFCDRCGQRLDWDDYADIPDDSFY